jgi:hypothetical protein
MLHIIWPLANTRNALSSSHSSGLHSTRSSSLRAQHMGLSTDVLLPPCRHDWKICPYAHPGEVARRRHPRGYTAVLCPAKTAVRTVSRIASSTKQQHQQRRRQQADQTLAARGTTVDSFAARILYAAGARPHVTLRFLYVCSPTEVHWFALHVSCAGVMSPPGAMHIRTQPM